MDLSRPGKAGGSLAYRPDIDGLRGLAVVLVVAYHAFPEFRTGGFVGVDVFFVISGYLITQIILTGLRTGKFSVVEFYRRRVRRIVPALLLVMTACCVFGWLVMLPTELQWLGKSTAYSGGFLANMYFARTGGYFDRAAELNPLLHLWSLGVEEQFYLVWPVLLILAVRYGVTLRILVAVTVTSLAISIWGAGYSPGQHFYYPAARAWELAGGGLLAASRLPRWPAAPVLSFGGLALILAGGVCWTADHPIPGVWSLIPTTGAVMLIAAGPQATVNRWFLGSAAMTFIGRISYPLYLWHWPVLSFTRIITGHSPQPAVAAVEVGLCIAAAYGTYRLLEAPIRFSDLGRRAVPGLLAGLALLTVIGIGASARGIPGRLSGPLFARWDAAVNDWNYPQEKPFDPRSGSGMVTAASHLDRKAVFIGDSHIEQYWPRIEHVVATRPGAARSAIFVTYYGCPPLPAFRGGWHGWDCSTYFDAAIAQALQPDVDTVVFGAFWEKYIQGQYVAADSTRRRVNGKQTDKQAPLRLDAPATEVVFEQFRNTVARLIASGRRVFIVLSNPTSPLFEPLLPPEIRLSARIPEALPPNSAPRVDAAGYESFVAPLMNRLRDIAARTGAEVLDPRSTICDGMICPAGGPDGIPLYVDSNHLSAHAARDRASFLDEILLSADTQSAAAARPHVLPFKQ